MHTNASAVHIAKVLYNILDATSICLLVLVKGTEGNVFLIKCGEERSCAFEQSKSVEALKIAQFEQFSDIRPKSSILFTKIFAEHCF